MHCTCIKSIYQEWRDYRQGTFWVFMFILELSKRWVWQKNCNPSTKKKKKTDRKDDQSTYSLYMNKIVILQFEIMQIFYAEALFSLLGERRVHQSLNHPSHPFESLKLISWNFLKKKKKKSSYFSLSIFFFNSLLCKLKFYHYLSSLIKSNPLADPYNWLCKWLA